MREGESRMRVRICFLFMSVNGVVEGGTVCCGGLADGWRSTPCRSSMGTVYDECEDETVEAKLRR
jgi:hypothetical protein